MITLVENESVHDGDCREITPTDPCLVSDSDPKIPATNISVQLSQKDLSSDSSFDSSEDKVPLPTLSKKRRNFKLRSISDSIDNEQNIGSEIKTGSRYPFQRGILKSSNYKNRLRSLSESCAENYSFSQGSNSGLDDWLKEEEIEEEDENGSDKVKKTVRFSDTVKRQLFRSNSSILGQRKKNQRKQKKKTKRRMSLLLH
jgi:dynein assembly factor 2